MKYVYVERGTNMRHVYYDHDGWDSFNDLYFTHRKGSLFQSYNHASWNVCVFKSYSDGHRSIKLIVYTSQNFYGGYAEMTKYYHTPYVNVKFIFKAVLR